MKVLPIITRCLLLALLLIAMGTFLPTPARAAFGLTSTDPNFYTVDTGAGLVFKVRRIDAGSNHQSPGDLASLIYNGVEYQDQVNGSQINSGFDYLGYPTSNVTVDATTIGTDYIKVTVTTDSLTHYYLARRGYPHIYMGTYFTVEPVTGGGLCRYILRTVYSRLPNGPAPSNLNGTDFTVESGDIFGFSATNSNTALIGQTRSKHYSNMRVIDWPYIGATGNNVGLWVVRDNYEGASGGPFYRSLLDQGTSTNQEITYIVNYGETQTEAFRTSILNSYTLVFTNGAAPTLPLDTSWFSQMGMTGYIPASGRGNVVGAGISGRDTSYTYTAGFANTTAQYFVKANAADGSFTSAGMLPGTYAMTIYKNELSVYTGSVTVAAGGVTNLSAIAITGDPSTAATLWRIGDWDGTPRELLNGDKITIMHPSDVRMSPWNPGTYIVGTSAPATGFPCYQWKDVNSSQAVQFTLTASQIRAYTVRVGITTAYAGGRPNITVNSWTAGLQGASTQPNSRTLTVGSYRGNNTLFAFSVPASALVVGTNTLYVFPISGTSGTGYLSPGYSTDCVDVLSPFNTIGGTVTLQGCASSAQPLVFTFTPASGSPVVQNVTPGADGSFLLSSIPSGAYTLRIKGAKWLSKSMTVNSIGGSVTVAPVTLLGGDLNGDNLVSAADLAAVRAAYGTVPGKTGWNANADVNCDGQVAGADLALVRANYGQSGN